MATLSCHITNVVTSLVSLTSRHYHPFILTNTHTSELVLGYIIDSVIIFLPTVSTFITRVVIVFAYSIKIVFYANEVSFISTLGEQITPTDVYIFILLSIQSKPDIATLKGPYSFRRYTR